MTRARAAARPSRADVVIIGAGIAGIAAAYHLCVHRGVRDVLLVDERAPLSLTSDKSTECYRNWWPGPGDAMVALMSRSIDWLERLTRESGDRFTMSRRGYLYATAEPQRVETLRAAAIEAHSLGAGALREHPSALRSDYVPAAARGIESSLDGADLILDPDLARRHFPCLSPRAVAVLHARRCGWLDAQQLGQYLLEQARDRGARLIEGRLETIEQTGGSVAGVTVLTRGQTTRIATTVVVDAAGPFLAPVAAKAGLDLPVSCESHVKVSFDDSLGAIDRASPLLIWTDPVNLPWSDDERAALLDDTQGRRLLEPYPAGVHTRPQGAGTSALVYWTLDNTPCEPRFPQDWDPTYPEVALRAMSVMVPALAGYFGRLPRPFVDGGYYTKTPENRPLIGPTPVPGLHLMGAFSGFGIMAACASGELLAAHVAGDDPPAYAPAFRLDRYADPGYGRGFESAASSGQL